MVGKGHGANHHGSEGKQRAKKSVVQDMSDDTRDIAIAVKTRLDGVERSLGEIASEVKELRSDFQQRQGAAKVGTAIIALGSSAMGAATVKLASWIGAIPIK